MMEEEVFLGIDVSTQSCTAALLSCSASHETPYHLEAIESLQFTKDLPQYNTDNGMHVSGPDGSTVTSPVFMWLDALDMLLMRLKQRHPALVNKVKAVSASGQQHGTVYWRDGAASSLAAMASLDDRTTLSRALTDCFSKVDCPIWADSSTTTECTALEKALGGKRATASATGSAAYCRFSGTQVAKIAANQPEVYAVTERISLVSSFITTVLLGCYAAIDCSDASGMNLMDIKTQKWHSGALAACCGSGNESGASQLAAKLGSIVPSHTILGPLSKFFSKKYGLPSDCQVIAASGDNPCSIAGLGLVAEDGDNIAVSLGTSDTVMGMTSDPRPQTEGHIMVSPLDPSYYFAMLVYKNGALTREKVRDRCAGGSWDTFSSLLEQSPAGNDGKIGLYLDLPEITPQIAHVGYFRRQISSNSGGAGGGGGGGGGEPADKGISFSPAEEVRAVVEGRFLSMRQRLIDMGIKSPKRILATGGASNNMAIMQVLADVFGVPVYTAEVSDAAAVGAALRACHGLVCHRKQPPPLPPPPAEDASSDSRHPSVSVPFSAIIGAFEHRGLKQVATAKRSGGSGGGVGGGDRSGGASRVLAVADVYTYMLEQYRALEESVMAEC